MNKSRFYGPNRSYITGFSVCAALFVLGCVAGAFTSGTLPAETPVGEYVASLNIYETAGFGTRFLSALITSGKYHLLVLFFAFSVLGVVGIPAVSLVRGFLICFAASSVIRFYGLASIPYALLQFAPEALIAIPALFLLSTQSLTASGSLLRVSASRALMSALPFGNGFFRRVLICAGMVCISAVVKAAIGPWVMSNLIM